MTTSSGAWSRRQSHGSPCVCNRKATRRNPPELANYQHNRKGFRVFKSLTRLRTTDILHRFGCTLYKDVSALLSKNTNDDTGSAKLRDELEGLQDTQLKCGLFKELA